jgi:uncharacterized protein (DUF58 family)
VRLTRLGLSALGGAAAMVVGGVAAGLAAAVALGAFLLVLVVVAATFVAEVPQLDVFRTGEPREVDRGRPARIRLSFESTTRRRPRPLTVIESIGGRLHAAAVPAIAAGDVHEVVYDVPTARRGVIVTGPLTVRRVDPFGLVRAERHFGGTVTISVRPRRHRLRMLPSGRQRDLEGPTRERSEGSASFHQLRPYVPGDDLRRIHWRSTARVGEPVVKHMVDTTQPEVVAVLDNREVAIDRDDFEHAVEIVASVLHAADAEGYPTTLLFADGDNARGTDGQPIQHIERLTVVGLTGDDSLGLLAERLHAGGRSLLFVTGALAGPDLVAVAKLARGFTPAYFVSVVGRRTAPLVAPPGMRAIACADAEEFTAHWTSLR